MTQDDIQKLKAEVGIRKMTQDDIQKLKADLKVEIIKELTGQDYKAANSKTGIFDEVRTKYRKPLYKKFGGPQVWDNIRQLSVRIAGVRYVRDLTPSKEIVAAETAEKLCKMALGEDITGIS